MKDGLVLLYSVCLHTTVPYSWVTFLQIKTAHPDSPTHPATPNPRQLRSSANKNFFRENFVKFGETGCEKLYEKGIVFTKYSRIECRLPPTFFQTEVCGNPIAWQPAHSLIILRPILGAGKPISRGVKNPFPANKKTAFSLIEILEPKMMPVRRGLLIGKHQQQILQSS